MYSSRVAADVRFVEAIQLRKDTEIDGCDFVGRGAGTCNAYSTVGKMTLKLR